MQPALVQPANETYGARGLELKEAQAQQQLRTFTRWWNSVLLPRGLELKDLIEDVRSGVMPLALYEELSGALVLRVNSNPKSRFQMLENQNMFLSLLKEKGLRFVNIGAEDLVDGNRTLLLGLTWTLILRYEIQKYGANEQELLRWVKTSTAGYSGVKISTWGDSFNDGLAFCALIHKHDPHALDYANLKPNDVHGNLELAFKVAEERFGVPRLLEPSELVGASPTDDRSVITYVAKLRQAFGDKERELRRLAEEEEKAKLAAARAKQRAETDRLAAELQRDAAALRAWAGQKAAAFRSAMEQESALGKSEGETLAKLGELRGAFRGEEKPPKFAEKGRLGQLYEKVRGQLLADAMTSGEGAPDPAASEKALVEAAPPALQAAWGDMEAAERDYEAALLARLAALERERQTAETDSLLNGLQQSAEKLLEWCRAKTDEMTKGARPPQLGNNPEEVAAAINKLSKFHLEEKPPKEADTVVVQRGLRDAAERLANEGRSPPPKLDEQLDRAWTGLDAAADALRRALDERAKQLEKQLAEAETDKMQAEGCRKAAAWLEAVAAKTNEFAKAVSTSDLGSTKAETEKKLNDFRTSHQQGQRPRWAEERAAFEAERRVIDERRRAEEREPAAWDPSADALSKGWGALGSNERDYEEALLKKLGQLQAEETERMRRAALRDEALASLAELLPPLMQRRHLEQQATAAAEAAAAEVTQLLPWIHAQQKTFNEQRAALEADADGSPVPRVLLTQLEDFDAGEKAKNQLLLVQARAALAQAAGMRQIQRAGTGEPEKAAASGVLPQVDSAWSEMVKAEADLKRSVQGRLNRLSGAALEWERLQRGCRAVSDWLLHSLEVRSCTDIGQNEEEVGTLLRSAQLVSAELEMQCEAVARLKPIAERLRADAEFGARATDAITQVIVVTSLAEPMRTRIGTLKAALERQKRLTAERLAFAVATSQLECCLAHGIELTGFPVDTIDTAEALSIVLESGNRHSAALLPAPEGAEPKAVQRAEAAVAGWQEVAAALPARSTACEAARRAALHANKLHTEYETASGAFDEWFTRSMSLLMLPAGAPAVGAKDVQRAVEIARAQLAEGQAHLRSANEVMRQMISYGVAKNNPSVVTLASMSARADQVRAVATQLLASSQQAPPIAPRDEVVKALNALAESTEKSSEAKAATPRFSFGGSRRRLSSGASGTLTRSILQAELPVPQVAFMCDELKETNGTMLPSSFDPFPADREPTPTLDLPSIVLDLRMHALAVIEHVNRARADPPAYGVQLRAQLDGCFEGTVFNCPSSWGTRRLRTVEGEAAVASLTSLLATTKAVPVLRLVPALNSVAQQLAEEFAAGKEPTQLMERMKARGTFSGSAGEAIVYGVQQPEAIAAQLLISDGDSQRRNRSFLLNGDLKVAGFGLAEHPKHDSVCVLTFATLFAAPLSEKTTVECQGEATPAFLEVIDAIPSEQARDIATDALVTGKKVQLQYEPGSIQITVFERDGSQRSSTLKWN